MHVEGLEHFEVGLEACPAAGVGTGDGEGDGPTRSLWHGGRVRGMGVESKGEVAGDAAARLDGSMFPGVRAWWMGWVGAACLMAGEPGFPEPHDSGRPASPPMSPEQSAASFRVPEGFRVQVFAGEPEVRQPVAMAFDLRGRLWVAENYTYAENGVHFDTRLRDRVIILHDLDGDGRADVRKVFWDGASILTSVEPVADGAWVLCPPRLLFVPDRDHDDVPDGPPTVVLDGFETTTGNRHTFANGLKWGPDGWLWGRVGISSGARVGRPGQLPAGRVEMRGGIWRFHPGTGVVEAVCHGTTNPWGLDWNAEGEPFFINTVIGHLWHAIPGAHFQRMHGDDVNPRSYALIGQHADHVHFDAGAGWTKSRAGDDGSVAAGIDALGGGHAHAGLMVYQGTNWPASYRDGLYTWNLHGRRMNRERLERRGSGYVGRHEPDVFRVGDPWFRGIELIEGPDGAVYVADWSDTGECHEHDGVHRGSGRIHRITWVGAGQAAGGGTHGVPMDAMGWGGVALADAVVGASEWASRAARKAVSLRGSMDEVARERLTKVLWGRGGRRERLRALWALHGSGAMDVDGLIRCQRDEDEHVRSWGVRLLGDRLAMASGRVGGMSDGTRRKIVGSWAAMARDERSPLVRLYLAGVLPRLDAAACERVALGLVQHGADAEDLNVGLVLWQAIEPMAERDPRRFTHVITQSRLPMLRLHGARRLAEDMGTRPEPLEELLAWAVRATRSEKRVQKEVMEGIALALRGLRQVTPPRGWDAFTVASSAFADPGTEARRREIEVVLGKGRAMEDLVRLAHDGKADVGARRSAMRTLVEARAPGVGDLLKKLAEDGSMRAGALVSLLELGEPGGTDVAMRMYPWLGLEERRLVVGAMAGRVESARALLGAMAKGVVQRGEVGLFDASRMARLGDSEVTRRLGEHWGTLRLDSGTRRADIERWRARLGPSVLARADVQRGRMVFQQTCAGCHRMHGEGGDVGPDLTGSGRADLGYLLENVVDPGAVVAASHRLTVVTMKDGRKVFGLLGNVNERSLTVRAPGTVETLPRADVGHWETLEQSMMPEGLLESVGEKDTADLMAYLMKP